MFITITFEQRSSKVVLVKFEEQPDIGIIIAMKFNVQAVILLLYINYRNSSYDECTSNMVTMHHNERVRSR